MLAADQVYTGSPGLPYGRQAIAGYIAGRTLTVRLRPRVKGPLTRAVFTVKTSRSDTDAAAKLKYTIDVPTANAWGQILDAGSATRRALVQFVLSPAATRLLGGLALYFEAAGLYADNTEAELEAGAFLLADWTADTIDAGNVNYIDLAVAQANVLVGATVQATATPRDSAGVALAGRTVEFFVNDEDLASVDANGLVTVKASGTIYVFARSGGVASYAVITASADDVGLLVGNLGTDSQVPGFYDTRRNVRINSTYPGLVYLWEDARIPTVGTSGFFRDQSTGFCQLGAYPGLDGVTKVTLMYWGAEYDAGSLGSTLWQGDANWELRNPTGTAIELRFSSGTIKATCPFPGQHVPYKLTVVYDGTQATNATKLLMYLSTFDRVTKVWSADVAQAVTFTGTIPATWPVSSGSQLMVGANGASGWNNVGWTDEVRIWSGAALTAGQLAAETLTASPANPTLRYDFANGGATNLGTTAGAWNGTWPSGNCPCSCNLTYGQPFYTRSNQPAWDAVNQIITFNDSNNLLILPFGGAIGQMGLAFGFSFVGTLPIWDGSGTDGIFGIKTNENAGQPGSGTSLLDLYVPDGANVAVVASFNLTGGAVSAATPKAAGRRVVHARRTVTGGSNDTLTAFVRMGSAAEVASATGTITAFNTPNSGVLGLQTNGGGAFSDAVVRAIVIKKSMVAADQVFINNWANTPSIHNAGI